MEEQIKMLQTQMGGVQTEIKLMNQTLQTVAHAFAELKDINTKIHDLELKLVVNNTKLGGGERIIWIITTALIGVGAAYLK